MPVPNTFADKGGTGQPAADLDENFNYLDNKIDAGGGGGTGSARYLFTQFASQTFDGPAGIIRSTGYNSIGVGDDSYVLYPVGTAPVVPNRYQTNTANGRVLILATNNGVNVDSLGGDEVALNEAYTLALSEDVPLTSGMGGTIAVSNYVELSNVSMYLDKTQVFFNDFVGGTAPANWNSTLPVNTYNGGTQAAPTTYTIHGPVIEIGGNPGSTEIFQKEIAINGNYNGPGDNQALPVVAVSISDDQRATSRYKVTIIRHRGDGLQIFRNTEKKTIDYLADHLYDGYALTIRSSNADTADEVVVNFTGTFFDGLFFGQDALQASFQVYFNVESVTPVGKFAIEDKTRKGSVYGGEIRGVTGNLFRQYTEYDGYTGYGPNLTFANLKVIQFYDGSFEILNPKEVSGLLHLDQVNTNRNAATGQDGLPSITVGEVMEASGLRVYTRRNVSAVGLRVGWAGHVNPDGIAGGLSFNKRISGGIVMGDENANNSATYTASIAGDILTPGTVTSGALQIGQMVSGPGIPPLTMIVKGPPSNLWTINRNLTIPAGTALTGFPPTPDLFTAIQFDKGDGGQADFRDACEGNIVIGPEWKNGLIELSSAFIRKGYKITKNAAATGVIVFYGPMTMGEVLGITWAVEGMVIMNVPELNGSAMYRNATNWTIMKPPVVPAVSLQARGSPFNAPELKELGMQLINSGDSSYTYSSQGSTDTAQWKAPSGAVITPAFLAATDAFVARAVSAGANGALFTTAVKLKYDRLLHDLIYAGVYDPSSEAASLILAYHAFLSPDEPSAKTNILFNFWNLTKFGTLPHTPYRGFDPASPNLGGYLAINMDGNITGVANAGSHGTTYDNFMGGASAEELNGSGQTHVSVGSNVSSFRVIVHRGDGGNSVRLNATNAIAAPAQFPAPSSYPSSGIPRTGMGFTDGAGQSIAMLGGPLTTGARNSPPNTDITALYYFRNGASDYLDLMLSQGILGKGVGWTEKKVSATLQAMATFRAGMRSFVP